VVLVTGLLEHRLGLVERPVVQVAALGRHHQVEAGALDRMIPAGSPVSHEAERRARP